MVVFQSVHAQFSCFSKARHGSKLHCDVGVAISISVVLPPSAASSQWPSASRSCGPRKNFGKIESFASSSVGKPWADRPEMQKVCEVLKTAREDFDKKPMIMFVGAFSAGKSTLINNLLGEKRCATGIRPTTNDLHFHDWHRHLLVDSTGLDNWNQPEHKQKALEAARRSNRAVLVINARQPIGEREIPILKQLAESQSKITVAINYWNHLETEEERSECMTYVQGCLEEIMPGLSVEVFPINAKSGSDPGVQQLSHFLRSTDDSGQKGVSASAAMRIAAQQMLDMCTAFETKAKQTHEMKIQRLDGDIASLEKDVEHSNALRRRDSADLQTEERVMRELEGQLARLAETDDASGIVTGTAQGVFAGSALGGPVGAVVGAPLGFFLGLLSADSTQKARERLNRQIEKKNQHIQHLNHKIWNATTTEKSTLMCKIKEKEQEVSAYKKNMEELAADRAKLQALLWRKWKTYDDMRNRSKVCHPGSWPAK